MFNWCESKRILKNPTSCSEPKAKESFKGSEDPEESRIIFEIVDFFKLFVCSIKLKDPSQLLEFSSIPQKFEHIEAVGLNLTVWLRWNRSKSLWDLRESQISQRFFPEMLRIWYFEAVELKWIVWLRLWTAQSEHQSSKWSVKMTRNLSKTFQTRQFEVIGL